MSRRRFRVPRPRVTPPGITGFYADGGEWRELVEPDAPATARQLARLNRLGHLAIVTNGGAVPISKGVASAVLDDARRGGEW